MPGVQNNLSYGGRHHSIFRDSLVHRSLSIKGTAAIKRVEAEEISTDVLKVAGVAVNGSVDLSNYSTTTDMNTAISTALSNHSDALTNLTDVQLTTPNDNDLLKYETSTGKWRNVAGATLAYDISLGDLNNVTLNPSIPDASLLMYYYGSWISYPFYTNFPHAFTGHTSKASGDVLYWNGSSYAWSNSIYQAPGSYLTSVSLSTISDWPSAVSATEVGYLDGVTSSVQTQLQCKFGYMTNVEDTAVNDVGNAKPSVGDVPTNTADWREYPSWNTSTDKIDLLGGKATLTSTGATINIAGYYRLSAHLFFSNYSGSRNRGIMTRFYKNSSTFVGPVASSYMFEQDLPDHNYGVSSDHAQITHFTQLSVNDTISVMTARIGGGGTIKTLAGYSTFHIEYLIT